jgi:hypothetical protein
MPSTDFYTRYYRSEWLFPGPVLSLSAFHFFQKYSKYYIFKNDMIVTPFNKQEQYDEGILYNDKHVLTMNYISAVNYIPNGSRCDVKHELAKLIANAGLNHLKTYKISHFIQI